MQLRCSDGYPLAATLFEPPRKEARSSLVIGSALGVPRYLYFKLARFLAARGWAVLTFDYRGIHESREGQVAGSDMRMEHWGSRDLQAALGWMLEHRPRAALCYLGHSCGGQILGLAPHAERVKAVILVASQSGYWKHWDWPYKWGVWWTWQTLGVLAPLFNYLPARLMGISSVNLPGGVARQWAAWGRRPRYLFDDRSGLDTSLYRRLEMPLLSVSMKDDPFFAPPRAVEALLREYPAALIERMEVRPGDLGLNRIGHFGFFRDKCRALWEETAAWLEAELAR
ncbi:MAG: alpha/beta fold hydrolase [Balneolaceae bacterium]|nr:alpha/beta fold hydrolase [Balneolaceae bacterium]